MKVLADTSVIIEYLRKTKKEKTIFSSLLDSYATIFISIITAGELYAGKSVEKKEVVQEIEKLIQSVYIIDIDLELIKRAGEVRRKTDITLVDAIIAASSLRLDLPLATLNLKDFRKVKDLEIYKTETPPTI